MNKKRHTGRNAGTERPPPAGDADRRTAFDSRLRWLALIYVLSGACALIDEVVWVRLLKLTLGNTVYATSVVVSVFLGGLTLGALLMGRWADRQRNPIRLYALIEMAVTVAALLLPWGLRLADVFYVWFYRQYAPSPAVLLPVQVLVSAAILLAPTLLMGSTFPLLGQYVMRLPGVFGHRVGRLYALNTLGAAAGTFLAGFVLLRAFGVWGALYTAAGVNLVVALGGWVLSRGDTLAAPAPSEAAEPEPAAGPAPAPDGRVWLLLAVFASGFISIGYEIVWMRSVVHLLGADTYVFSSVLTVYLLGNVLGALMGSRLARRLTDSRAGFGVSLALLGIAGLLYLPALFLWDKSGLPELESWFRGVLASSLVSPPVVFPLLNGFVLFLLPSVLMGLGFPLALEAWHRRRHEPGRTAARVYGVNTIGAVVSGLATGFVFLPGIGVQSTVTVLGLVGVGIGAALCNASTGRPPLKWIMGVAVPAAAFTLALSLPRDLFRRQFVVYEQTQLVEVKEGATTTVSVHREPNGEKWLCTAGIQVAGDRLKCVQRILGHTGPILRPDAKQILSVGFGTGETTLCLARHRPERLDCVELSPELVAMSLKHFSHRNLGARLRREVNMTFMDAKNYLHLTDRRYNLIVTDSISPKAFAENASLYTREYFQSARDRLEPGGTVMCWTPSNIPESCFRSIVGTFLEVFPHVTAWFPTVMPDHFVLFVGSLEPQKFSLRHVQQELIRPGVREDLAGIWIHDAFDFFSGYIGDQNDLRRYAAEYRPNADFTPYVEFCPEPFLTIPEKWAAFARFLDASRSPSLLAHLDWTGLTDGEKEGALADWNLRYRFNTVILTVATGRDITLTDDEISWIVRQLDSYLDRHEDFMQGYMLRGAIANQEGKPDRAIADLNLYLAADPESVFALNERGFAYISKGEMAKAIPDLDEAIRLKPDHFLACLNRGIATFKLGRHAESVVYFEQAIRLRQDNYVAYAMRGHAQSALGQYGAAIADYTAALRLNPRKPALLAARASCRFKKGDFPPAWEDVKQCEAKGGRVDPDLRSAIQKALGSAGHHN